MSDIEVEWQEELTCFKGSFQSDVAKIIPRLAQLLKKNPEIIKRVIKTFMQYSEYLRVEWHDSNNVEAGLHSDIKAAIPQLVSYLSHERSDVRDIAVDITKAFAAQGEYFKMKWS